MGKGERERERFLSFAPSRSRRGNIGCCSFSLLLPLLSKRLSQNESGSRQREREQRLRLSPPPPRPRSLARSEEVLLRGRKLLSQELPLSLLSKNHTHPPPTNKHTAHKHTALSLRPGKLVSNGLFSHSRNPNYFGELLTYLCLAGLPACALQSFLPLLPLGASLLLEWVPNMKQKDASLRRHGSEWEAWATRAPLLFPWRGAVEAAKEVVKSVGLLRVRVAAAKQEK